MSWSIAGPFSLQAASILNLYEVSLALSVELSIEACLVHCFMCSHGHLNILNWMQCCKQFTVQCFHCLPVNSVRLWLQYSKREWYYVVDLQSEVSARGSSYFHQQKTELLITLAFISSEIYRSLTHVSHSFSLSLPLYLSPFPCLDKSYYHLMCVYWDTDGTPTHFNKDKRWSTEALKIAELNTKSWSYSDLVCLHTFIHQIFTSNNILGCYNSIMLNCEKKMIFK